ncbi:MAG TPA: hypothetical protein VGL42_06870 [Opitutaceae bacterium]|jgi:hypothetical protein
MKPALRIVFSFFALCAFAAAAFAGDPTGTWKWTTHSQYGDFATTLKLESKDGKLSGSYSNQFGDTAIRNASLHDDALAFDVVRNVNGNEYVVKYHGKLQGDTITGMIEAPGHDGGKGVTLDWNATRAGPDKPVDAH